MKFQLIENIYYIDKTVMNKTLHNHNGYQLIYVKKGSVDMKIDEKTYHIIAPCVVSLGLFEKHEILSYDEYYSRFILVLNMKETDKSLNQKLVMFLKLRPKNFNHVSNISTDSVENFNALFELLLSEFDNKLLLSDELIKCEVQKLLILLNRINPIDLERISNDKIFEIQEYIDNHFGDDLNIKKLAAKFFLSESHLFHSFKKFTGHSPKSYLTLTRLLNAKTLLLNTDFSVLKISELCGYKDINNFIRQFKSCYFKSPLQYRKGQRLN